VKRKPSIPKPFARIAVDPYNYDLVVFIDSRKFRDYVNAYRSENKVTQDMLTEAGGLCSALHHRSEMVLGVFNGNSGTLVHELSHVCFRILQSCGVPAEADSSEAFAYLIGHLFLKCREALNGG
jgi:hypothetical protein